MSIVITCLIILLYAVIFAAFFKRSVCETLISAVICPVFLLYLFGLLNFKGCLIVGMIAILILACILFILTLKKHGFRSLIKKTEFITGAVLFLVLVVAVFIMNFNLRIHIWDEFDHWGMRLKYILTYNALPIYTEPGAWDLSPYCFYPPGTALLSYLFSFTGFSEWKAYFSQQLFLLLLLTPFIKDILKKGALFLSIVFFSMFFLFFGAMGAYATLYVDSFLGILFGFALVYYIRFARNNDSFGLFITTCIVSMIALTKDVGFLLSIGVCVVMLFDGIVFTQKDGASRIIRIVRRLPALAIVVISYMSWTIYLKVIGEGLLKDIKLSGFFTLFSRGILEDWQRIVRWRMVFEVFPNSPIGGIFNGMSYISIVFLFLVFGIIYSIINGFKRNISWVAIITIGAGFYAVFLLYVYCILGVSWVSVQFHSYDRYSISYLFSFPIIICSLIYPMRNNLKTYSIPKLINIGQTDKNIIITIEKIIINSILSLLYKFTKLINIRQTDKNFTITIGKFVLNTILFIILAYFVFIRSLSIVPYNQSFPFITNRDLFKPSPYTEFQKFIPALNDGELLQIMTPGDTGMQWQQMRYQLIGPNVNILNWEQIKFSVGEKPYFPDYFGTDDPFTLIVNPEEWGDWLISNGIKKMLLCNPTPEFIESYSTMFPEGIKPYTLYRIVQNDNGVYFEEIII